MIGQTILRYPALRDPEQRDKILEKIGEGDMGVVYKVPKFPVSVFQRAVGISRIPMEGSGIGRRSI